MDTLLHGPWFVISGLEALLLMILRCLAAALLFGLIIFLASLVDGEVITSWGPLLLAALAFGVGSVLLGLPSGVGIRSVKDDHVERLATEIFLQAPDLAMMSLVRQGVEEIELVGQRRTSAMRWALGLLWALLIWIVSNWILGPGVSNEARSYAIGYAFVMVFFFGLIGGIVACYQMAQSQLRQTLRFAFLEAERSQQLREEGRPPSN